MLVSYINLYKLTSQHIWLQELLEPKLFSADLIKKTYTPQTPQTDIPFQGPEVGNRTYGMGQWSYKYRGYDIVE